MDSKGFLFLIQWVYKMVEKIASVANLGMIFFARDELFVSVASSISRKLVKFFFLVRYETII